jgi:chaperone modulatory protein CbpM
MKTDYIIVKEYCEKCHIDPSFILSLDEGGLVTLNEIDGEKYLPVADLPEVEQYARMYYDLSINIEGIDVIHNMQQQIKSLHQTIKRLHDRLRIYEDDSIVDNLTDDLGLFSDKM